MPAPAPDVREAPSYAPREDEPETDLKGELGAGYLQSLARGLAVLRVLGASRGGLSLTETAQAAGLPRATARRSLITLRHLGYARTDGRTFSLLPRVLELGYARLSDLNFGEIVSPHLVDLVGRIHESASISVLDGDDIRYVARVPTTRIMSVNITVGTRFPAYATSMGRVLLAGLTAPERAAYLARVRPEPLTPHTLTTADALLAALDRAAHDGHALVDEELEEGLRSLAVPLRDRAGQVIAAVNVSQHAGRCTPEETLGTVLPALATAAARMEADLAVVTEHISRL